MPNPDCYGDKYDQHEERSSEQREEDLFYNIDRSQDQILKAGYKDAYEALSKLSGQEVTAATEQETLRSIFKQTARKYHPDLHKGDPKAVEKSQLLSNINTLFGDSKTREHYNRYLRSSSRARQATENVRRSKTDKTQPESNEKDFREFEDMLIEKEQQIRTHLRHITDMTQQTFSLTSEILSTEEIFKHMDYLDNYRKRSKEFLNNFSDLPKGMEKVSQKAKALLELLDAEYGKAVRQVAKAIVDNQLENLRAAISEQRSLNSLGARTKELGLDLSSFHSPGKSFEEVYKKALEIRDLLLDLTPSNTQEKVLTVYQELEKLKISSISTNIEATEPSKPAEKIKVKVDPNFKTHLEGKFQELHAEIQTEFKSLAETSVRILEITDELLDLETLSKRLDFLDDTKSHLEKSITGYTDIARQSGLSAEDLPSNGLQSELEKEYQEQRLLVQQKFCAHQLNALNRFLNDCESKLKDGNYSLQAKLKGFYQHAAQIKSLLDHPNYNDRKERLFQRLEKVYADYQKAPAAASKARETESSRPKLRGYEIRPSRYGSGVTLFKEGQSVLGDMESFESIEDWNGKFLVGKKLGSLYIIQDPENWKNDFEAKMTSYRTLLLRPEGIIVGESIGRKNLIFPSGKVYKPERLLSSYDDFSVRNGQIYGKPIFGAEENLMSLSEYLQK